MEYEWDPEKDRANREKHGVSFAEASTVFLDPLHITVFDERHSIEELRFRTIGYTAANRLVIVAHTDREDRIRIITAREATPRSDDNMSKRPDELEDDDIPETDFSGGVRGKYYERAMQGTNIVLLEPDVAKVFRDSAVVS